jgi:hypothetical protein
MSTTISVYVIVWNLNDDRADARAGNDIQFTERPSVYACLPNILYTGTSSKQVVHT